MTTAAAPSLLLRGLSRRQLIGLDALLAVAAVGLCWFAAAESPLPQHHGWHEPAWVSALAGLLQAAPVAARRRWPVAAAAWATALLAVSVGSGLTPAYAGLAPAAIVCLTLYTVGTDVRRWSSIRVCIACVVVTAAAFPLMAGDPFGTGVAAWLLGASWTVGRAVRERRAFAARSAEQATELAVGQERLRIARELHDIVTHSMSMIAVKATIADHLADARPQEMREALRIIATTSRDSLSELRRALGVLRVEGQLAPAPGLADLDGLASAARSAGLAVDLEVRGSDTLPEGVALAVYRLVQEAVTNVVRHAGATSCRIDVDIGTGEVRLRVTDDGTGGVGTGGGAHGGGGHGGGGLAGGGAGGQGLIGMRERAAMFGGDLVAGPGPGGRGWEVATTLRYEP